MSIRKRLFGEADAKNVYEYTLKNANGVEVSCLNYGCAITKIIAPDRWGNFENIVLGYQNLAGYENNPIFAGVVVGRVAGRIQCAQFELEGKTFALDRNDGNNHLHGGSKGFHKVVWDAEIMGEERESIIRFSHTSLDGEEGYPGTLKTEITYSLNNHNELMIRYQGQSDRTTLFNPTNHTYFNLSGNLQKDICQHYLKIDSSRFLEVTDRFLPTGRLLDVNGTAFDFKAGRKIIEGIDSTDFQNIIVGRGYDQTFLLDSNNNGEIVLKDGENGRRLVVETDAPCVVLYTGNHIPADLDIGGTKSKRYLGLSLETQWPPDAIHHSDFPSCILPKDQVFSTTTRYTFGI